jgi:hypothetical protein
MKKEKDIFTQKTDKDARDEIKNIIKIIGF